MQPHPITNNKELNVFAGPDALRRFLDPDCAPPLPLVEIPKELNPFAVDGVRIFAKLMHFLPLGNVKSLPAYNMLRSHESELGEVSTLIENSSGNTVFSLAVIGRLFGINKTKAIVSNEVSRGKLDLLRFFGTEIIVNREPICPDPGDPTSGIHQAKKLGMQKCWFNPGQYDNLANPLAHEQWTGPQIWQQTGGNISVLCAGLGTTGTIVGTSRYLKKVSPMLLSVGVARSANNPVPGVRTPSLLREVAFDWKREVDEVVEVGTTESFEMSLALSRSGVLAGPSSGFALAGLHAFLHKQKAEGDFDSLRNASGEVICVFICPDGPLPYLAEYFEYLDPSHFPAIEHEHLLSERNAAPTLKAQPKVSALDAYNMLYSKSQAQIWNEIELEHEISLNPDTIVVDVRRDDEFEDAHLPGAKHIELNKLAVSLPDLKREAADKQVLFICKSGGRSETACAMARTEGIGGYTIQGGMIEWSRLGLPRIRPSTCTTDHPDHEF